jgi:phosphoserine phosphatase RsbU/P
MACCILRLPKLLFICFVVIALCADVLAQAPIFDASNLAKPANLDARWLIHAGDDPAYARPDFDDSQWTPFDPNSPLKAVFQHSRPEIVWYRLRIRVDPTRPIALSETIISRAFEIYVNGEHLMAVGQVQPYVPYTHFARILARVPDHMLASGTIVIAQRVRISRNEWATDQNAGYFVTNLRIGQEETLYRDGWLTIIGQNGLDWLDRLLRIGLGCVALVLYAAQRRQTVYLWIFAVGAVTLAESIIPVTTTFYNIPVLWELINSVPRFLSPYIWASLYFTFVHQRVGWRWRAFLITAGVLNLIAGLQGWFLAIPLPLQLLTNLPFVILLSVIIPIVLIVHWRRGNREAGILLIPIILYSLYIYADVGLQTLFQFPARRAVAAHWLNLINRHPVGPFSVSLDSLSGILCTLSLAIIMLRRSATMSKRQAQLDAELEAAREVQQVLVPEQTGAVPGFKVESAYEPAQQVGGDFFQVLPDGTGGVLIVVGDVAGKGLPAAMLVSVLVGAIRGVAEFTKDPAELLANLNERLVGRGGSGFSTALIARIGADGQVSVANAGHLSPYLDGTEVELPGALPLGVATATHYTTTEFRLDPGSRLTFYSDGVIEAQRPDGELFGFERARKVSMKSAAEIVETAKRFGQEDDITVVTVTRTAAVASAA